jgi:hypothetical protein
MLPGSYTLNRFHKIPILSNRNRGTRRSIGEVKSHGQPRLAPTGASPRSSRSRRRAALPLRLSYRCYKVGTDRLASGCLRHRPFGLRHFLAAAVEPPAARVKRRDCGDSREVDGVHNTLAEYTKRSTPGANPFALIPTCTFAISQQGDEDYRHENVHVRCGPGVVRRVVR